MANNKRYENFNKELRSLLTYKEEVFMRDDGSYSEDSGTYEKFENYKHLMFIIYTDYEPDDEDISKLHIDYYYKREGTKEFKNLIEKYNMNWDWDTNSSIFVYNFSKFILNVP